MASLVNVHHIKAAINTLRSWYKSVRDSSVDESTKHIIEVSNNATSKMLLLMKLCLPGLYN